MSVQNVKEALDEFLSSAEPRAIALTGKWGRGKTFFWNLVIKEFIRANGVKEGAKYSYVSLFGVSNISQLKDAIFENAVSAAEIFEGATAETLLANTGSLANEQSTSSPANTQDSGWLGRFGRFFNGRKNLSLLEQIPWLNKFGPFARSAAFLSIHRYIICFDDIERRGRGLEPKEIFGLISLLTEQRQCKVIAILNSDALPDTDCNEYESFREKVFDFEIKYVPSPSDCGNLVFDKKDPNLLLASQYTQMLGITNIRILQRIRRAIGVLVPKVQVYEPEITRNVIHSLVLLTWCYNGKEPGTPSYEYLKRSSYFGFSPRRDKKEQPSEEIEWNEILQMYGYQTTDDLDGQICFYLENGFLANEKFLAAVESLNASILQSKAQGAFSDIWDIYHGSFKDNETDLINAINDRLRAGAKWISLGNVHGAISLLRELKKNDLADELIDHWIKVTTGLNVENLNLDAAPFSDQIRDEVFRRKLKTAFAAEQKQLPFETVMFNIARGNGWSFVDEQVLAGASSKDFYHFFKNTEDGNLHKYVKACLRFGEFANPSEAQLRIAENTKDALRKIGAESLLNGIRVRGFGIEIPAIPSSPES